MSNITPQWLLELGGIHGLATAGGEYWDFPIASRYSKCGETYLRIHEPCSDGEWATDLFDAEGHAVGIVNWPTSRQQLLQLLDALGCVTRLSLLPQVDLERGIFANAELENPRESCR